MHLNQYSIFIVIQLTFSYLTLQVVGNGEPATNYVAKLARRYGYPMERHKTITDDGYILTMYLMPQEGDSRMSAKTVFLSHGLFASSNCFFINERKAILPFKLYDEGYNVMLGNYRGTIPSLKHTNLFYNSSKYWDFSFDEIGRYDVARMIDYTLEELKQKKLFLIGHSMGTTTAFVLLTERPEYNDKLYRFIALAPSVFEFRSKSPWRRYLAPLMGVSRIQKSILSHSALAEGVMPPYYSKLEEWRLNCAKAIVGKSYWNSSVNDQLTGQNCQSFLETLGIFADRLGKEGFETLLSVPLEPSSVRTVMHYLQNMNGRYFRRYDYGRVKNVVKYGSLWPPSYDLSKVTCPTSIYWGLNDEFAVEEDVRTLIQRLPKSKARSLGLNEVYQIKDDKWNHFDYILSSEAATHINPSILSSLKLID